MTRDPKDYIPAVSFQGLDVLIDARQARRQGHTIQEAQAHIRGLVEAHSVPVVVEGSRLIILLVIQGVVPVEQAHTFRAALELYLRSQALVTAIGSMGGAIRSV